jgi:hypothetical protein
MTDAVVSAIDLTVFGGPTSIDVDVDFGTQGERGSRIFGVIEDPRLLNTPKPVDAKVFDIAINVTPGTGTYLTFFQKTGSGAEDWIPMTELFPNIYSAKEEVQFSAGTATFDIILNEVFTIEDGNYDVERFSIQHTIENVEPGQPRFAVSSSISLAVNAVGPNFVLTITINAIEYNPTGNNGQPIWLNVSGPRTLHVLATVV